MSKIRCIWPEIKDFGVEIDEQIEIDSHYRGYLKSKMQIFYAWLLREMRIYLFR
ncbi:MAG: hypothetical protein CM15mP63_5530 [Gammaproteobacteria bacterium]|nr:MAG: hypothetical protein CM15mP63_5530 [Gammaproteobacteria bacterium]